MWQSNSRMSLSFVESKGLLNEPGENNCFLNSAVQVLWHLDVFRRSFRLLTGHMCMGNACIFCALKVIFTQFQYSDQSALPPDALRKALAKTFKDQQRFQLGLMDDAAECFENILTRIHGHITSGVSDENCRAPHCISHQKFTQRLLEQAICSCGATSEPHVFNQMVHYVAANVLCAEKINLCTGPVNNLSPEYFTRLLRNASTLGDTRKCPNNCGRQSHIRKTLTNSPEVISVGLIWNSDRPSQSMIQQVLDSIGTRLLLSQLYESVKAPLPQEEFRLVGVVCYYGKHYSTFFFHSKKNTWISFDDANVKEMGGWYEVANKCTRGHYQPLLLLYASPDPLPIPTETALHKTTMVTGHSFSNDSVLHQSQDHKRQSSGSSVERALHPGGQKQRDRAEVAGSEWATYHSDEEGQASSEATGHFRQSSYLSAMEAMAKQADMANNLHNQCKQSAPHPPPTSTAQSVDRISNYTLSSNGAQHLPPASTAQCTDRMSNYTAPSNSAQYASHTNNEPAWSKQYSNQNQNHSGYHSTNQNQVENYDYQYRTSQASNSSGGVLYHHEGQNLNSNLNVTSDINNQFLENHYNSELKRPPQVCVPPATERSERNAFPLHQEDSCAYPGGGATSGWQAEEPDGTYINRKAVEKVLGLQSGKQRPSLSRIAQSHSSHPTQVHSASHSTLPNSSVNPRPAPSGNSIMERLIRGSTTPLNNAHRPPAQHAVDKRFSSEESLSSASAGSIGTVKAHQPSQNALSRSQESLIIIEDSTKPVREIIHKMEKPLQKVNEGKAPVPGSHTDESVLSKATSLMDRCADKESSGDFAAALVHCQQAIGNLQQVINRSDVEANVRLLAKNKCKGYMEKSRSLHQQVQMCRQVSSNSTSSSHSEDRHSVTSCDDRGSLHSVPPHSTTVSSSKTVEFPTPPAFSVVQSFATEDFPSYVPLSQRRKFMSDYVSREDYFMHHPPPPRSKADGSCSNKSGRPVVPPKPGVKPLLKHSISSENQTHPGQGQLPKQDSINIYATLPRRPKNRERSSTLTGLEPSSTIHVALNQGTQSSVKSDLINPNSIAQHNEEQNCQRGNPSDCRKPAQYSGPVINQTVNSRQSTDQGTTRQHTTKSHHKPTDRGLSAHPANSMDMPNVFRDNNSTLEANQVQSNYRGVSNNMKNYSNASNAPEGPKCPQTKAEDCVDSKGKASLVNHARQWSKEEIRELLVKDFYQSRTESTHPSNQPSLQNMVNQQMQQLTLNSSQSGVKQTRDSTHTAHYTSQHSQPAPSQNHPATEAVSIQRVPPQQCVHKSDNAASGRHHPHVTIRHPKGGSPQEAFSRLEAHQLALQHRPDVGQGFPAMNLNQSQAEKPVENVSPSTVGHVEDLPAPPPELLEPLCEPSHSVAGRGEPTLLEGYVVPGLRSIVDCSKISFAPHSSDERVVRDRDLADFHVVSRRECEPDLSSSSGIERTDTQSDTSSVSTANSRNSHNSHSSRHSAKPALTKKRRHKPRKSVTFSDNILLIARAQDEVEMPEETNYIEYVQKLLKRSPVKSEGAAPDTHHKQDAKTGYDSDFDEDTTDSCTSDEVMASDKVQCNLCRKKLIHASNIYCVDCSAYMAQFQPSQG